MRLLYRFVIHNLIIFKTTMKRRSGKSKEVKPTMNKVALKKGKFHTLDLSMIDGEGSFPCPKCGTMISPDDETEEVYKIVDTKVVGDELIELVISCGTCGTVTRLTGFQQVMDGLTNE